MSDQTDSIETKLDDFYQYLAGEGQFEQATLICDSLSEIRRLKKSIAEESLATVAALDQLRWRRFGDEKPEVGTPVLVWIAGSKKSNEAWVAELAYPNRKLVWRALELEDEVADDDRWQPITGPEVLDTTDTCCNNVLG